MNAIVYCGAALIVVTLSLALKEQRREFALLVSFAGGLLLLSYAIREGRELFDTVSSLTGQADLEGKSVSVLLKSVAIALCTQMTADACRDAGEAGIANKAELCGRVMICVISLPVVEEVIVLAKTLLFSF